MSVARCMLLKDDINTNLPFRSPSHLHIFILLSPSTFHLQYFQLNQLNKLINLINGRVSAAHPLTFPEADHHIFQIERSSRPNRRGILPSIFPHFRTFRALYL